MFGGSGNYASALFIAAAKANALEKVESELADFVAATTKASTFSQFMKDLAVPADTRVKAINEISAQAKFSDVTKNFLGIDQFRFSCVDIDMEDFFNDFINEVAFFC